MLVDQEVTAEEKRLDILASGTDGDQDAIAVIIENQYGATDHRHLGQIITYLAQQQHGLAIWIAEDFSQAHLAAVDFLNRTSIEGVGYLLVRVRFTHALEEYQVHFEVLSRPNAFLKSSTRTSVRKSNPDVVEFVAPVWESLKEPLKQGGLKGVRMHKHGSYIRVRLPDATGLRTVGGYLTYRVTAKDAKVLLGIDGLETGEENLAALRAVKKHYEHRVESPSPRRSINGRGGSVERCGRMPPQP